MTLWNLFHSFVQAFMELAKFLNRVLENLLEKFKARLRHFELKIYIPKVTLGANYIRQEQRYGWFTCLEGGRREEGVLLV